MNIEVILRETSAYFEAVAEQDEELELLQEEDFSQEDGMNLLLDSMFATYTLESIQLEILPYLL